MNLKIQNGNSSLKSTNTGTDNLVLLQYDCVDSGDLFIWVSPTKYEEMQRLDSELLKKFGFGFQFGKRVGVFFLFMLGNINLSVKSVAAKNMPHTEIVIVDERNQILCPHFPKNDPYEKFEKEMQLKNYFSQLSIENGISKQTLVKNSIPVPILQITNYKKNYVQIKEIRPFILQNDFISSSFKNKNLLLKGGQRKETEKKLAIEKAKLFFGPEKLSFQEKRKLLSNPEVVREVIILSYQEVSLNFKTLVDQKKIHSTLFQVVIQNPIKIIFTSVVLFNLKTISRFVFSSSYRKQIFTLINDQIQAQFCNSLFERNLSLEDTVRLLSNKQEELLSKIAVRETMIGKQKSLLEINKNRIQDLGTQVNLCKDMYQNLQKVENGGKVNLKNQGKKMEKEKFDFSTSITASSPSSSNSKGPMRPSAQNRANRNKKE